MTWMVISGFMEKDKELKWKVSKYSVEGLKTNAWDCL